MLDLTLRMPGFQGREFSKGEALFLLEEGILPNAAALRRHLEPILAQASAYDLADFAEILLICKKLLQWDKSGELMDHNENAREMENLIFMGFGVPGLAKFRCGESDDLLLRIGYFFVKWRREILEQVLPKMPSLAKQMMLAEALCLAEAVVHHYDGATDLDNPGRDGLTPSQRRACELKARLLLGTPAAQRAGKGRAAR